MLRKINAAFAEKYGNIDDQNKIIIDIEKNVFTDAEVTLYIEKYGLLLTDRCRWTEIIKLHNNSTIGKSTSPLYNLVLGISYYYCGEYFKALDYFKESYKKIDNLDSTLTEYLLFFYFSIQRILGIMNSKEYDDATQNFDENGSIKIYQKLESISDLISEMYVSEDYICADFEFRIKEIISNSQISNHLRLLAEIELVYYKSEQLICRLILLLEFGETNKVEENFNLINGEYHSILNKTEVQNSLFINRYCMIRHSRFIIHFDCILRWRGVPSEFLNTLLPKILENIQISYADFKEINHVENELYSLTVLLEYYQNLDLVNKISEINTIIKSYKAQYLNPDFNKKIDYTNASGTFVNQIINTKKNIDKKYSEMEKMKIELEELDEVEKQSNYANYEAAFVVNLFPMGYFQFPEEKISCFFEILKIKNDELKTQLKNMFEVVIPVINCFVINLDREGVLNGNLECRSIDNYKNMYRIRKEIYENKFYRKELKFP